MVKTVAQAKREFQPKIQQESFIWMDNPHIQKLLDVVISIIADEYIWTARQNPETLSNSGTRK